MGCTRRRPDLLRCSSECVRLGTITRRVVAVCAVRCSGRGGGSCRGRRELGPLLHSHFKALSRQGETVANSQWIRNLSSGAVRRRVARDRPHPCETVERSATCLMRGRTAMRSRARDRNIDNKEG
jgi:hypothetical protein